MIVFLGGTISKIVAHRPRDGRQRVHGKGTRSVNGSDLFVLGQSGTFKKRNGWCLCVLEPAELRLRPSLLLDRLSVPRSIGSAVRPDTFLKWDDLRGIQAPHSPASLTKASSAAGQLKRISSRVSIAHVVPNLKFNIRRIQCVRD
ncbi:hypothetical protein HI914_01641 [Erysiphe necator]|nr:hypothetical protein HI914_01641 [Erysiphe necator]